MQRYRVKEIVIAAVLVLGGRAHGDFVEGIDVSHWQGTINWTSVSHAGIEFAFTKATEGDGYVDPRFHANMQGATAAGVLIGPYHFCRVDSGTNDPMDPVNEANHFLDLIQPYYNTGQYLPPVADVEALPDFPMIAEERVFISNWVRDFSDTIHDALGVRPIVYNSKYGANTYYESDVASAHELWLAWWRGTGTSNPPVPSDTPLWGDWQFWQWTSSWSVPGISGAVDGDVFDGTTQELMLLAIGPDPGGPGNAVSITDFEVDEGYFRWSPLYSGSNQGILDGSAADRIEAEAHDGIAAQEIFIDGDPNGWFLRHLSGDETPPSSPATNLSLESTGFVGFWLKTDDPGISVQIAVDDPVTADRGIERPVISDGDWHLYEWDFENSNQWEGWVNGDGTITGPTVTLDSIQFFGAGDATIYLDTIAHNPNGSLLPLAGDFNGDGDVDGDDLPMWQTGFGLQNGAELADGDADGNGSVGGGDFLIWQCQLGSSSESGSVAAAVPEPTSLCLLAVILTLSACRGLRIVGVHGLACEVAVDGDSAG